MDDATRTGIEISKINFLLENLYAIVAKQAGAGPDDIPAIADEMRRQANLPGTVFGPEPTGEELRRGVELLGHRLDMFFVGVAGRLRSDQQT